MNDVSQTPFFGTVIEHLNLQVHSEQNSAASSCTGQPVHVEQVAHSLVVEASFPFKLEQFTKRSSTEISEHSAVQVGLVSLRC